MNKETTIRAANGRSYQALTVFAHALRFFYEHAVQELSDQSATTILNEDIRWVITVPAIWKAPAKQFMRLAAYQVMIICRQPVVFTLWSSMDSFWISCSQISVIFGV